MLVNAGTAVITAEVLLVPYEAKHVPTYHEWMKDEELQEATASEPLSLEQELAMQISWRHDRDKLTFIICHPLPDQRLQVTGLDDRPESMLGDVNLFLSQSDDEDGCVVGEVEIMIAQKSTRGRGLGRASLMAFLQYIVYHESEIVKEYLKPDQSRPAELGFLRVRIGQSNNQSLKLFEAVGFARQYEEANVFGEVELRTRAPVRELLRTALCSYPVGIYREVKYPG